MINYIFQVINSDNSKLGYVIYTEKNNRLICSIKEFEKNQKPIKN